MPVPEEGYAKNQKLLKPSYTVSVNGTNLSIKSSTNARYVFVSSDDDELEFSANYISLYAGYNETIMLNKSIDVKKIKVISLYDVLHR